MTDALLREVLAETRRQADATERLADAVAALVRGGRRKPGERELLMALYPPARSVVRDSLFTMADVLGWPTLAPIVVGHNATSLAWIAGRWEGVVLAGYWIERVGTDAAGALWRLHAEVTASAPAGDAACVPMIPTD